MQTLNSVQTFFKTKKSGSILGSLLFFVITPACSSPDLSQYGRVTLHGPTNKGAFTFYVSEEYLRANQDSKIDPSNTRMTKAESQLLLKLLKNSDYCLNEDKKTFFKITSKQEKIYDMTFAHLIEQNYKARPVTPRMYYGECISKPITKKDAIKQIINETKSTIKE